MDPLSIIASVAGLLGCAARVSSVILDLTRTSKNAPQSIRDVKAEVEGLRATLEQVQGLILRRSATNISRAAWILVEQVVVVLSGCVMTFSELEVFVDSLKSDDSLGILDRLRWAGKASTAAELVGKVQNHKISLISMLTILESHSTLEAEDAVMKLTVLVEQVLVSNRIIQERLKSIEFGASVSAAEREGLVHSDPEYAMLDAVRRDAQGYAFEEELSRSWVYKRSLSHGDGDGDSFSIISAAGRSASWSMLSSLSLSDISNISVLALPIYAYDIANRERYVFGEPPESGHVQVLEKNGRPSSRRDLSPARYSMPVFGTSLEASLHLASSSISFHGAKHVYGYIPIIVAKCGNFLKVRGAAAEVEIFFKSGHAPRVSQLQRDFSEPPTYGRHVVYDPEKFTLHDYASVLLRYLKRLSEPIIPYEHYHKMKDAFSPSILPSDGAGELEEPVRDSIIRRIRPIVASLPPLNSQLLVYVLDVLSVVASKSEGNKMTAPRLVACLQPALLSSYPDQMSELEHEIANSVCVFMVNNSDSWLDLPNGINEEALQEASEAKLLPEIIP